MDNFINPMLNSEDDERDFIFDMNETLEEEIISIQMSDSFVESYPREKLDLVKPDEVLIEIDITTIDFIMNVYDVDCLVNTLFEFFRLCPIGQKSH